MPKQKTHSGTKKRIKVTGSGRLRRQMAGRRHLMEKKSSKLSRRLEGTTDVSRRDTRAIRRLLRR
ncbi:50S ribosomal protein L35 [Haloechinothrix sp. LS1_15]|uniref:50S ribosomal protein L35 n=1 Tax=Haloechinothrix sp. LS1_15 TaxID=2652248 RepID=UPI002945C6CD|nr:50S ribosomal protein L35 [Haloechinothrix sp. LS1_15]MDV6012258.1 50S ribosomal protein L35 [Haloechinothrix sp. LS1_15]